MDTKAQYDFTNIIRLVTQVFTEIEYTTDTTPERAILRLQAKYGQYRVYITELLDKRIRKYRYYALKDEWIEAGFDNSPDPRALRLKYGRIDKQHTGEYIPHLHQENKTQLELTEDMGLLNGCKNTYQGRIYRRNFQY